jgi:sugar lactone lactonase YvrE
MKAVADQVEADWADGRWADAEVGPFLTSAVLTPNGRTDKGITIKLGDDVQATVCFNTELLGYNAAWAGGFLEFKPNRYGLTSWPSPKGNMIFANGNAVGWAHESNWNDPRANKRGPLPRHWAKYRGLYRHGKRVALNYSVGEASVLESPWAGEAGGQPFLSRAFEIGASETELSCLIASDKDLAAELVNPTTAKLFNDARAVWVRALGQGATLGVSGKRIHLNIAAGKTKRLAKVLICNSEEGLKQTAAQHGTIQSPARFTKAGPGIWQPLQTKGIVGKARGAFAIDTIRLPFDNPWKALLFTSGHDFLDDKSALVATVHGDVWRVTGIDATLNSITWTRYATGLFQPLGLKVVDNRGYVIGRDQITRLHDFNGDGEADYYENFNNDVFTSSRGHAFNTNLETDSKGNFYFTKCAEANPHGGTVLRVSADGAKLNVHATGFRNPNGMGVSPHDIVTVGDQQGGWVPETRVDATRKGGFYGYMPMHHRSKEPKTYDVPFAFVPRVMDNSAGGQLWVPADHWGPLAGRMVHLSYGRCTALIGIPDRSNKSQGAMINLPGRYLSGAMRGRFNPHDGHMYVSGLRGWQTSAVHDGCFQRLRLVGGQLRQPVDYATGPGKIEITFDTPLDRELAEDPESYSLEQWNYLWSSQYGSKDWSVRDPEKNGRDPVAIQSAKLSKDHKTVVLSVPDLTKAMQFELKYDMDDAEGELVRGSMAGTINEL